MGSFFIILKHYDVSNAQDRTHSSTARGAPQVPSDSHTSKIAATRRRWLTSELTQRCEKITTALSKPSPPIVHRRQGELTTTSVSHIAVAVAQSRRRSPPYFPRFSSVVLCRQKNWIRLLHNPFDHALMQRKGQKRLIDTQTVCERNTWLLSLHHVWHLRSKHMEGTRRTRCIAANFARGRESRQSVDHGHQKSAHIDVLSNLTARLHERLRRRELNVIREDVRNAIWLDALVQWRMCK